MDEEVHQPHPGQTAIPDAPQPPPDHRCHWCQRPATHIELDINLPTVKKNRLPRVNACDLHHETVVLASLREREAERQERLRLARVAKGIFK